MAEFKGISKQAFNLLARYKENNDGANYKREEFGPLVREPFQAIAESLYPLISNKLPQLGISDLRILSSHANRSNKLFHHFWGAFYREKQEKKSNDVQLFFYIEPTQFKFGVYMGYGIDAKLRKNVFAQIDEHPEKLREVVGQVRSQKPLKIALDDTHGFLIREITLEEVKSSNLEVAQNGVNFYFSFTPEEVASAGPSFIETIKSGFERLLPLYAFLLERDNGQRSELNPPPQVETSSAEPVNYWAYSPGEGAKFWSEFQREKIIAIGWDQLGRDLREFKVKPDLDAAFKRAYSMESDPINASKACMDFLHVMKPGDIVFVKKGMGTLLGYGRVTSEYRYASTRSTYKHVRAIEWISVGEWDLAEDDSFAVKALTRITNYPDFVERLLAMADAKPKVATTVARSPYSRDEALSELFIDGELFDSMIRSLGRKKNIILQGPPGAGKTFLAKRLAYSMLGEKAPDQVEMVQFHQSYSYEDFVQGFRPSPGGGFERRNGIFFEFCQEARQNPTKTYFFVIDEINRGNLSRVFGELLLLLESDKRGDEFAIPLTYSRDRREVFSIPENLCIIGTMNTADRSLSVVDYALRRRFAFFDIKPEIKSAKFRDYLLVRGATEDFVNRMVMKIDRLNQAIAQDSKHLGAGFMIGHSYFCSVSVGQVPDDAWLHNILELEVSGLLKEYWFDDEERVASELAKLAA